MRVCSLYGEIGVMKLIEGESNEGYMELFTYLSVTEGGEVSFWFKLPAGQDFS